MEYPWLQTARYAKERFEIRFQFHVDEDVGISSLKNSLLVYLGQSTVGKFCLIYIPMQLFVLYKRVVDTIYFYGNQIINL